MTSDTDDFGQRMTRTPFRSAVGVPQSAADPGHILISWLRHCHGRLVFVSVDRWPGSACSPSRRSRRASFIARYKRPQKSTPKTADELNNKYLFEINTRLDHRRAPLAENGRALYQPFLPAERGGPISSGT